MTMNQKKALYAFGSLDREATQTPKANPAGSFSMRMGSTTYIIGVHFSAESKDTLEDKMKRLMRDDVKADNF